MNIYIAIWPGDHDFMGTAIRFLTHGTGTHAAFVRNGKIIENFYPHVRERAFKPCELSKVEIYEIDGGSTWERMINLSDWLDEQLAKPKNYSIIDLLRYAVNWPPLRGNRGFCSMFVLEGALKFICPILCRLPYKYYGSPRDIRISPYLKPITFQQYNELARIADIETQREIAANSKGN